MDDKTIAFDMQPPVFVSKEEHLRALINIMARELLKNGYKITFYENGVANELHLTE